MMNPDAVLVFLGLIVGAYVVCALGGARRALRG